MDMEKNEKVQPEHRNRNAYLYVRQSTLRQVVENTKAGNDNMRCETERWNWDGTRSRSW